MSKRLHPDRLRYEVTYRLPGGEPVRDASGNVEPGEPVDYTYPSDVQAAEPGAGTTRRLEQSGITTAQPYEVLTRYRDHLKTTHMRVVHDGMNMQVHQAYDPEGDKEWLKLLCYEIQT